MLALLAATACSDATDSEELNAAPEPAAVTKQIDGLLATSTVSLSEPPLVPTANGGGAFATATSTSRFLTQATFGPRPNEVSRLIGSNPSQWFVRELNKPPSLHLPVLQAYLSVIEDPLELTEFRGERTTFSFWSKALGARDQLRQRTAFALSQLLVVSNFGGETLSDIAEAVAYFEDVLITGAFGNYRDLLEQVTYAPAMGFYLTYLGSIKADPQTGRMPDENYAREILQLFSIGLVALNPDGTPRLDDDGHPIETYTNEDVTGLAKVFTGLDIFTDDEEFPFDPWIAPMFVNPEEHSTAAKTFLGVTIPPFTDSATSIDIALDTIFAHPNVGPFVARQLIQRFTTSDPTPAYVERVAAAFDAGSYPLPDGTRVGTGERGDLAATVAAILFDDYVRSDERLDDPTFGKLREPILRFTSWARAFGASTVTPQYTRELWDTSASGALTQHPYRSRSVFNFYRPGYVAPGTQSGALGMTVPELQLVNASSTPGYVNFLDFFIDGETAFTDVRALFEAFRDEGVRLDPRRARTSFLPNYAPELALVDTPTALIDHLADKLTYGTLSPELRAGIVSALDAFALDPAVDDATLVQTAITLVMSSPDFLVQR